MQNDNFSNSSYYQFAPLEIAFDRVKVSNRKYDKIIRGNKSIYGYTCNICNGCFGYHMTIQSIFPHDFVRGAYKELSNIEQNK